MTEVENFEFAYAEELETFLKKRNSVMPLFVGTDGDSCLSPKMRRKPFF